MKVYLLYMEELIKIIPERAKSAADWLVRSIEACQGKGSAAFYSRWYYPVKGWAWPYPETTGYIIPTLINYAKFSNQSQYDTLAIRQAEWILSLQFADGALPGGAVVRGQRAKPSVFNTAQMILGLTAAWDNTHDQKYLHAAERATLWLANESDPTTGTWPRYAYISGFSPAYYTHVSWPMLEVFFRTQNPRIKDTAVNVLKGIASWQQENGAIKNWEFYPGKPAFTHTIAYTICGFLESSRILGNEGKEFEEVAIKSADAILKCLETKGRLAGAYDLRLNGRYWYTCLTGNCQLAIIWMKLFEQLKDKRFLDGAITALEFVMKKQRMRSLDPNVRGAIPGSSPVWGRYLTLRYPNWATKYYIDALMQLSNFIPFYGDNGHEHQ